MRRPSAPGFEPPIQPAQPVLPAQPVSPAQPVLPVQSALPPTPPHPNWQPQQPVYPHSEHTQRELKRTHRLLKKNLRGKPAPPISAFGPLQTLGLLISRSFKTIVLVVLLCVFLIGGFGSGILFGYIATTEPIQTELLKTGSETSYLYDLNGEIISKQTGSLNIDRRYIPFDQVQDTALPEAFVSIEDERYLQHIGIDPKRIASAILSAVTNGGVPTHGGSTIVQQTVKLVTGSDQRSAQRKIQEWYRAILLDEQLSKTEIMELYLNLVPMGNSYIGVEAAAEGYFGKHASELTLPECAFLAGIPKGPSIYNPRTESGMRNALRRQRVVLSKMYELGKISREAYDEALRTDIVLHDPPQEQSASSVQSYFVEYVLSDVVDRLVENGLNRNLAYQYVSSGGLKIYTTLEPRVQEALDEAFNNRELFQQNPNYYEDFPEKPEAGMVILNNETGGIAALQGGYGLKTNNLLFNRATSLARQPGSSIKPLVVYAPAIDLGRFVGSSIIQDKEVFFNGPDRPWPLNYDRTYRGPVTLRNALKASLNVPAVTILKEIGVDTGKRYLKNLGIDWTQDEVGLAAAVGAPQHGVSPLQMAQAYLSFPNEGVYREAHAFTQVVDRNGNVILSNENQTQQRVFKPETAFILNTMLQENLRKITSAFGMYSDAAKYFPLKNAQGQEIPAGGKTGTTDDNVDKWFCGFTRYYTGAVWFGFDNNIKKTSIPEQDWENPIRIWKQVFEKIHTDQKPKDWNRPSDIVERDINIYDGQLANPALAPNTTMKEYYPQNSPLIPQGYSKPPEPEKTDEDDEDSSDFNDWFERFKRSRKQENPFIEFKPGRGRERDRNNP